MAKMGHFTLPVGQDPEDVYNVDICIFREKVGSVLATADKDGAYMLYQCVDDNGMPSNIVPICRVRKPLLLGLPAVYLDTSAVSYIQQEDAADKMAATLKFWEAAKDYKFMLYLSDVTLEELLRCPEPKRTTMFDFLKRVSYATIQTTGHDGINRLGNEIREMGILPQRSGADIIHIAAAIYARCDVIASWNFKHLVNPSTVKGARTVALENCCGSIDILTPERILEVYL